MDHRRVVCRLRCPVPAIQRRGLRRTTTTCTSAASPRPAAAAGHRRLCHLVLPAPPRGEQPAVCQGNIDTAETALPFFALLVALLMVSRIPLPACRQPGVARPAQLRTRRAVALRHGRHHVGPRLLGADSRLAPVRALRSAQIRMAADLFERPRIGRSHLLSSRETGTPVCSQASCNVWPTSAQRSRSRRDPFADSRRPEISRRRTRGATASRSTAAASP